MPEMPKVVVISRLRLSDKIMDAAESSSSDVIWAKLVPSDSKYSDIEIRSIEFVICSPILASSLENHKWCKIIRNSDKCSATMQNISSNAILVDEAVIQREDEIIINCGSEIISGPSKDGYLNYRFKVMPPPQSSTQQLQVSINAEHAKCCICLNIWHDAVSVGPCLHNFCNGCFSEWLRRSQEKRSNVLCPHCRAVVLFVGRNHFLHNIEEDILRADSSLRRSDEEIALLDSSSSIKSNLVIQNGKKLKRKRAFSMLDVESVREESMCPQCGTEQFGGFRCDQNTAHLQCQACGGMMPARTDFGVPQHCLGCDRAFCGAYWHAQGVTGSDSHMVCSHDNFKPISERLLSRIPFLAHEKNRHEQDITASCISAMGKTLQEVISDWIGKFNRRELDRSRLELNHAEVITAGTHVCNDCYDKMVSFLLYWIRICMPRHYLPPEARKREDCWYGYSCRTQHHNEEHARKRNHVCRPTRGSQMLR